MKPSQTIFLFLFLSILVVGCASHRPLTSESELAQATIHAQYRVPLDKISFGPTDVEPIMRDAAQAVGSGIKNKAWSSEELSKIERFLRLCKWALGYRGKEIQLMLISAPKSFHKGGTVYLSVENDARYAVMSLIHEFGGHGVFSERQASINILNPASWFGSPSEELTGEIRAETAVALLFKRLNIYSRWSPVPELQFYPLDEPGEPELWAFFIKEEESNPEAKTFVEKLRAVQNYRGLEAFCANREHPEFALVWLCGILLEAHYRDLEALWLFLHSCNDDLLKQEINRILQLMPADLAVKMFIEQRKTLFR